jgi:P pilus assembly chaperone PapD
MIKLLQVVCMGISLISFNADALMLNPMKYTFSGKNKTKSFIITNNESYNMKFKLEVLMRGFSKSNIEERLPSHDFKIVKQTLEIAAGKSRRVVLKYVGSKSGKERSYILSIKELNGNLDTSKLNYLSEIEASLYIGSKNQRASLSVINAVKINNNLELSFRNTGNKHIRLGRYKVVLRQGGKKVSISFRSKKYAKLGQQLILPDNTRKITIENIASFTPGKVEAKFHRLYIK